MSYKLPNFLTFVRHGFSEMNAVHELTDYSMSDSGVADMLRKHDSEVRLTSQGVKESIQAGFCIKNIILNKETPGVSLSFVSPYKRALETAYNLGEFFGEWIIEDAWRERERGLVTGLTQDEIDVSWPEQANLYYKNPWYWQPPSGESFSSDVLNRVENFFSKLTQKESNKTEHVLIVSHREIIRAAQFSLEQLTPESWNLMNDDPKYALANGMLLQYKKETSDEYYTHRRAICPWDENLSWDDGEWVELNPGNRKLTRNEVLSLIENNKVKLGDSALENTMFTPGPGSPHRLEMFIPSKRNENSLVSNNNSLKNLANNPAWQVRFWVASQEHAGVDIIKRLCEDENIQVARLAKNTLKKLK